MTETNQRSDPRTTIQEIDVYTIVGLHGESCSVWVDSVWLTEESCNDRMINMPPENWGNDGCVEFFVKKSKLRR